MLRVTQLRVAALSPDRPICPTELPGSAATFRVCRPHPESQSTSVPKTREGGGHPSVYVTEMSGLTESSDRNQSSGWGPEPVWLSG